MSEGLLVAAARLAPVERLGALAELQGQIARLQARQLALLAAIEADPVTVSLPGVSDKSWAVEDVAVALRLSPGVARARLAEAREAVRLPRLFELLAAGRVSVGHVRAATEQTLPLGDEAVAAVEDRVLARAVEQSPVAFRAAVRRAVLAVAAPNLEQRRLANVAERRVCLRRAGEGTSELWALLPDEGAAALMTAVTALAAKRTADDERSADQRRADALVQLGLDSLAGEISTVLPRQQRFRPAVQVSVGLATLLHLTDEPGELAGIGPISAELARRLAHDPTGTWRRLLTDPTGRLLDYGRTTYRPPADLARHVIARDRTCRFPHCTRTAARSDLDHTHPWTDGGVTSAANLTALCPRHHHLRHETAWRYRRHDNGDTEWTSPAGARHVVPAATHPTDTTSPDTSADPDPPPF